MRQVILAAALAVGAATTLSTPSSAQYLHCVWTYGCVPATPASYNACYQLALQRGQNISRGDRNSRNWFIYQCLAGKIPR